MVDTPTLTELKGLLIQDFSWLAAFNKSIEEQVFELVADRVKGKGPYDPRSFDVYLHDLAALADRCVQYRREAMELEVLAVRAAIDYKLFRLNTPLDRALEQNQLAQSVLNLQISKYREGADRASPNPLAIELAIKSDIAREELAGSEERKSLLEEKRAILIDYQEEYQKRHETPGNAHNYAERLSRVVDLLSEDAVELFFKLQAIRDGILGLLGVALPEVPAFSPVNNIHNLVVFSKRCIREVEVASNQFVEFNVVIPLSQLQEDGQSILDHDALMHSIHNGPNPRRAHFDLSERFSGFDFVRTIAVGMSFSTSGGNYLIRATLVAPLQAPFIGRGDRQVIGLGAIGPLGGLFPVQMESSQSARNFDPRGRWDIAVERYGIGGADALPIDQPILAAWPVQDIQLHLRVTGRPKPDLASVFSHHG